MTLLTGSYCRTLAPWARNRSLLAIKSQCVEELTAVNPITALPYVICRARHFYQKDRHGPGYAKYDRQPRPNEIERVKLGIHHWKTGLKMLPGEFAKWKEEWRVNLKENKPMDMNWDYADGTFIKEFEFRGRDSFKNWTVSTDRVWGEGFTKAELTLSKNNMALFQGHLCTDLPAEGTVKRAGWASIQSPEKKKSFQRDDRYNWLHFTHFIARVRGDGRTYVIRLHTPGHYDVTWNDMYCFYIF